MAFLVFLVARTEVGRHGQASAQQWYCPMMRRLWCLEIRKSDDGTDWMIFSGKICSNDPEIPWNDQIDRCRHRPNSLRYESDLPWTAANQTWQPDFGDRKPDGNHRGWEDHGRSTWSWLKNPPCRQESSTSKAKKADNYTDNIDQWIYHIYIYITCIIGIIYNQSSIWS